MKIGIETAKELGKAGASYEGGLTQTNSGIHIQLTWNRNVVVDKFLPARDMPRDDFMQDIFIAHHIRKLAERLSELIKREEKFV